MTVIFEILFVLLLGMFPIMFVYAGIEYVQANHPDVWPRIRHLVKNVSRSLATEIYCFAILTRGKVRWYLYGKKAAMAEGLTDEAHAYNACVRTRIAFMYWDCLEWKGIHLSCRRGKYILPALH